jgi:hypothetical protein
VSRWFRVFSVRCDSVGVGGFFFGCLDNRNGGRLAGTRRWNGTGRLGNGPAAGFGGFGYRRPAATRDQLLGKAKGRIIDRARRRLGVHTRGAQHVHQVFARDAQISGRLENPQALLLFSPIAETAARGSPVPP